MFEVIFEKLRIPLFERLLDVSVERQRSIASNIANIGTPGYKAKDVDFNKVLEQKNTKVIKGHRTDERHMPIGEKVDYKVHNSMMESSSKELKSGENNVDIDIEMSKVAENQLLYSAAAKIINAKFMALHKSIRGRT